MMWQLEETGKIPPKQQSSKSIIEVGSFQQQKDMHILLLYTTQTEN